MALAAMITALFADPVLVKDATYQPQGGGSLAVRVMAKQPDATVSFGEAQIHTATAIFDVQAKDVPQPAVGDHLTVDGIVYVIQSEPIADCERLIWTLNTRPA